MVHKYLKIFTIGIFISLLLLPAKAKSCGYYEGVWEYRTMAFQAQLPYMRGLDPFLYTTASVFYVMNSDPLNNDRKKNVDEWQKATSASIVFDDIYVIQYKTEPADFIDAVERNDWKKFAGNTFVNFLKESKNKDLLEYMLFAKKAELTEKYYGDTQFESWESQSNDENIINKRKLHEIAENRLNDRLSPFLRERYAFQYIRLSWQVEYPVLAIETYEKEFVKPDKESLMNIWSCLFVAMSYDKKNERDIANRYYSYVFRYSYEKKLRTIQMYNKVDEMDEKATNEDKSMHYLMSSIHYPGRTLESMEKIYKLDKNNHFLSFMVKREINKLEEWLIDPLYLKTIVSPYDCAGWQNNYVDSTNYRFIEQNKEADRAYLERLKEFITKVSLSIKVNEEKDFYHLALAHLCLLDEKADEARMYLKRISSKSNETIQYQKLIEETWLAIHNSDITSNSFKQLFATNMRTLETTVSPNLPKFTARFYDRKDEITSRIFYTLNLALASKYKKAGDIVHYTLLKNKSDIYRTRTSSGIGDFYPPDLEYWSYGSFYYQRIKHLDYFASTGDIDKYIALMEKTKKTDFENYLCDQLFLPMDAYRDLKGTIAFRHGNLDLAYSSFSSMDQNYWKNDYEFTVCLNENPFIPKWWLYEGKRDYSYNFNKTEFVKALLNFHKKSQSNDKQKAAEAYLSLGHAYYNVSYYGNSWMMMSYGRSSDDNYFEQPTDCLPTWRKEYFNCGRALEFYKKAFDMASENDTKAFASLMLTGVYNLRRNWQVVDSDSINRQKYAEIYYKNYKGKTSFDKQNECFGYENFVSLKVLKGN